MRKYLASRLCDDYTVTQMSPEEPTQEGVGEHKTVVEQINDIPEQECAKMRIAVFEAIVDDIIEEVVTTEQADNREKAVDDKVAPIVDKAIAMHIVPSSIRGRINTLIAKHLRKTDSRKALLAKAAHFVMEAETEIDEKISENIEVDQSTVVQPEVSKEVESAVSTEIDNSEVKPSMVVRNLFNRYMHGEITEDEMSEQIRAATSTEVTATSEPVEEEDQTPVIRPIDVAIPESIPEEQKAALRYLAASSLNHRSATVAVSRTLSSHLLNDMLHQLRYCLPKEFVAKYRVK